MSKRKKRGSVDDPFLFSESELLPIQKQIELFYEYKNNGNREAFKKLLSCNIRLAYKIADSYACEKLKEDLRSEAILALAFAIERWDPSRGVLTTIATQVIKQRLTRFLIENSHSIRIPYLVYKNYCSKEDIVKHDIKPILDSKYLNAKQEVEEKLTTDNCSSGEHKGATYELLNRLEPAYRYLLELVYGIGEHYDDRISIKQLSHMLKISRNKLRSRLFQIREYISNSSQCKRCGKSFFRKNRKCVYCSSCRSRFNLPSCAEFEDF